MKTKSNPIVSSLLLIGSAVVLLSSAGLNAHGQGISVTLGTQTLFFTTTTDVSGTWTIMGLKYDQTTIIYETLKKAQPAPVEWTPLLLVAMALLFVCVVVGTLLRRKSTGPEPVKATKQQDFCINCGFRLLPDAKFCGKCGAEL